MITAAVVTGKHEYDVVAFHTMLRALPGVDAYPQHLEDWATDPGNAGDKYDAVVFFNYHLQTPGRDGDDELARAAEKVERLLEQRRGIFLLHHAIVAFPKWPVWSSLRGIDGFDLIRGHVDQQFEIKIERPDHPITRGLSPWTMHDETYAMQSAGEGSEVLLTADHPLSMRSIAWTRQVQGSRVFCYQSGHDRSAYEDANFRTIVGRGIQWVAGAI